MAEIPIPADQYFRDFAFELVEYEIKRNGAIIAIIEGLSNEEDGEKYIHFPHGSDIVVGDTLNTDDSSFDVKKISTDTYHGKPALIKVCF